MTRPSRVFPTDLLRFKKNKKKISMVTAYDVMTAELADQAGIDVLLVGDSCGNVISGHSTTVPVTLDQMIYHTQAVVRGAHRALVIADMPFMSYQESITQARANAGRLLKETGASAVKLEILPHDIETLKAIVDIGIPVMGHIGFTPQTMVQLGGYKVQGKTEESATAMVDLAQKIEAAGAFGLVLEMIPSPLAAQIQSQLTIPTIGIGAGPDCDGQVLVFHDLVGWSARTPKFVKQYATLRQTITEAFETYKNDVETGQFPTSEHEF